MNIRNIKIIEYFNKFSRKKKRIIIDIRDLNKIIIIDLYFFYFNRILYYK